MISTPTMSFDEKQDSNTIHEISYFRSIFINTSFLNNLEHGAGGYYYYFIIIISLLFCTPVSLYYYKIVHVAVPLRLALCL